MKIRSSFVSNSSSSSFLLLYSSKDKLKKFSGFNGYEILMRDLKDRSESQTRERVSGHISGRYYEFFRDFEEIILGRYFEWCGAEEDSRIVFYNFADMIDDQTNHSNDPFEEENPGDTGLSNYLYRIQNQIELLAEEIFSEICKDEKIQSSPYATKEYDKFHKLFREILDRNEKNFVDTAVERLMSIDKKCAVVSYSDEFETSSYMEHYFMPFVGRDPDGDVVVDCLNMH